MAAGIRGAVAGAVLLTLLGSGCTSSPGRSPNDKLSHSRFAPRQRSPDPVRRPVPTACPLPAPTSAAGYAALWETIPNKQWAGGDIGISVQVGNRDVWLYGDSWRPGAADGAHLVHSAAVVQTGGCVRAANGGRQLLPNDDPHHIYWIQDARAVSATTLEISARLIRVTGSAPWDFEDGGQYRSAWFAITAGGDLTFLRWTRRISSPPPAGTSFYSARGTPVADPGPDHIFYALHTHPECVLADGRTLTTLAQNWTDGRRHTRPSWKAENAPIWLERRPPG